MKDIPKAAITTIPRVKATAIPNIGVEVLYRDTHTTTNSLVIEGNVEVVYETYLLEGMPYYEAAIVDAANRDFVYAKMPLIGIRLIRFLYAKKSEEVV
jgi:hypothetical protein